MSATPGSILGFEAKSLTGETIRFADMAGRVVLIVNTASECGFTPQYAGLQALHEAYAERGLVVVGFPCNQFGAQEPGSAAEAYLREWLTLEHEVNPLNLEQGKQLFGELTRGPNMPLRRVFQKLQENVVLKDDFDYGEGINLNPFEAKKTGSQSSNRAGDVARTFAPLLAFTLPPAGKESDVALDNYHVHLREVRDAISKALDNTEEKKALRERLVSAIDDTDALIKDGNLEAWTKDTDELLLTPLRQLRKLVELTGATEDTNNWCAAIVDPMYERFNGRYPFTADSRDDVVLSDFEEFFHPENGVIRKAREELSSYITREGNYMVARDMGKSDVARIDPAVIGRSRVPKKKSPFSSSRSLPALQQRRVQTCGLGPGRHAHDGRQPAGHARHRHP